MKQETRKMLKNSQNHGSTVNNGPTFPLKTTLLLSHVSIYSQDWDHGN